MDANMLTGQFIIRFLAASQTHQSERNAATHSKIFNDSFIMFMRIYCTSNHSSLNLLILKR